MIQLFRKFFNSKVGIGITLAFLVLIAIAFASSDVANTSVFGGVSGGDRVAVVGSERIDAAELDLTARSALDQLQQNDPTVTMQAFVDQGGLDTVLNQLLSRTALAEFARRHGMRAGDRLVDSEIAQLPAFRGPDGRFDEAVFRATLNQRGFTEAAVRRDLGAGLLARQLVTPIGFSPVMPTSFGQRYATLLREQRRGTIGLLPSAAFAPEDDPTPEQLQAFYRANNNRFVRPERRVIRFAQFGADTVGDLPAPTEAQIAERFQRDRAQYAAIERRRLTQLVVPTEAAANAILAEVRGGTSLDAAARSKGLATAAIGPVTEAEFANNASAAVAQAAFAAAEGTLAQPTRGALGWYILRVEGIERQPERTLAQAQSEIATALAAEQRAAALEDLSARLEDEFSEGRSLSEVARELNLEVTSTAPATADGRIYQREGETVPPILGRVLETAFQMEEGEPQLAVVAPGETFVIFDVGDITPSAAPPLAEIRADVVEVWKLEEGAKAARAAADRILARLAEGTGFAAAIAAESETLPAPEPVNFNREDLGRQGRVPTTLALFFSMAAGTAKKLEAPADGGWFVLQLDAIEPGQIEAGDPIIAATLRQLGTLTGEEYVEQFVKAAQREVGIERNEAAIRAVEAQLTGQSAG